MPASKPEYVSQASRQEDAPPCRAAACRAPALRFRDVALLLAALLLTACATAPSSWPTATTATTGPEAAFARGDYNAAATSWQREALQAPPEKAGALRVRAADAWLLADEPARARDLLKWIVREDLDREDNARLDLVLADLALRRHRPDEAEALLQQAATRLPASARERYRALSDETRRQLASPVSRDLARAARLIGEMQFYDPAAAVEIMRSLESVSSGELEVRAENPRAERQLTGWLDLALVIRQNLVTGDGVRSDVATWKNRHPFHLLDEGQALDTWLRYRQLFAPPRRVAVLLPTAGGLKAPAQAIRDGLLSAYLAAPAGSELRFFPTSDDPQSTVAAYFSAVDAGADSIIGPLRKESIESMLALAGLATRVLALNELPADYRAPAGLEGEVCGLSLSQDAEAAAVARRAAALGYERAIVLAPENGWGERMASAFQAEFLQQDRQIIAALRYPPGENDHSMVLERALNIDQSKARKRQLQNTLGVPLEFEPVRREDVDVVFMAADPRHGRLIRPQLRFLDAGDVPVFATGRVFSGQPDPRRNRDLDGVRFPLTPWELEHPKAADIPVLASLRGGALASLYALGQDAWNLLPWLELMEKDRDFSFPGRSGAYRMGVGGMLRREPAWATFRTGYPVALPPPPSPVITPTIAR